MNIAVSPELAATIRTPPKIERIRISSREQWLSERKKDVTASSAAALLGIHPYQTAYSLWAVKTGRISDELEDTPPLRRGRLMEPLAVKILHEDYPNWQFSDHPVGLYFRDPENRIGATPDLLAHNEQRELGSIQIKSVEASVFRREWQKEGGEVEPPLWIVAQAIIEAALVGAQWTAVAPIVVGHGIELPVVPIPLHTGLFDRIKAEIAAFWRLVESGNVPDIDYGKDGDLLARLHTGDERIIDMSRDNELADIIASREIISAQRKESDARWDENRARILAKLQGAGAARMADGRIITAKRITIKEHVRAASERIDIRIKKGAAA